jgi:hypothetical protein
MMWRGLSERGRPQSALTADDILYWAADRF